ncbi:MAG: hypothetical protein LBK82_11420 [Planctomycetaceae bacterium]|nr:hypothetical protein [Planctomycetaceae bacterium]
MKMRLRKLDSDLFGNRRLSFRWAVAAGCYALPLKGQRKNLQSSCKEERLG